MRPRHKLIHAIPLTVLERIVRDARFKTKGTIFNKSMLILAYSDDICIIGESSKALKETFDFLNRSVRNMGLAVNENKTKYFITYAREHSSLPRTNEYNFGSVFKYLGSELTADNVVKQKLIAANKCYYGLLRYMKSRNLHRTIRYFRTKGSYALF